MKCLIEQIWGYYYQFFIYLKGWLGLCRKRTPVQLEPRVPDHVPVPPARRARSVHVAQPEPRPSPGAVGQQTARFGGQLARATIPTTARVRRRRTRLRQVRRPSNVHVRLVRRALERWRRWRWTWRWSSTAGRQLLPTPASPGADVVVLVDAGRRVRAVRWWRPEKPRLVRHKKNQPKSKTKITKVNKKNWKRWRSSYRLANLVSIVPSVRFCYNWTVKVIK
jgi:hypothetical protein